MKKYLLVSLTILFAAAFVWAEEAAPATPSVDVEADATLSWGIDLGKGDISGETIKHGFKNALSWEVTFPLIKKGNKMSAKSDAPVYADVTLKDIELNIQSKHDAKDFALDGKVDKLAAKLVFYGAYLQVYNKPSFVTNYANLWDPLRISDDYKDNKGKKKDNTTYKFEPGFKGYGTKIGYANKNFMNLDIGLKLGSNGNWEAEDKDAAESETVDYFDGKKKLGKNQTAKKLAELSNASAKVYTAKDGDLDPGTYLVTTKKDKDIAPHSRYGIGLDFAMMPLDKMLGIKLNLNSTLTSAQSHVKDGKNKRGYDNLVYSNQVEDSVAFNIGAEVTSEPIEALKFKLGFDGGSSLRTDNVDKNNKKLSTFAWDMLFNTEYKWISGGVYVASAATKYEGFAGNTTDKSKQYTADMAMYVKFETKGETKDGKKEASYLVDGLNAGVHLGLYNLFTYAQKNANSKIQLPMLIKLWGSYKLNMNDSSWIKPFATVWAETNHGENKSGKSITVPYVGFAYDLGLTYSPVEKVEVTAKWEHGQLRKDEYGDLRGKLIKAPLNNKVHNGRFTLALKVIY